MFRKESRGDVRVGLDTQLPKRVIVTDGNEEWGLRCGGASAGLWLWLWLWPAFEPSNAMRYASVEINNTKHTAARR